MNIIFRQASGELAAAAEVFGLTTRRLLVCLGSAAAGRCGG